MLADLLNNKEQKSTNTEWIHKDMHETHITRTSCRYRLIPGLAPCTVQVS
jgi:hypothetical protein